MDTIDVDHSKKIALDIIKAHLPREGFSADLLRRIAHRYQDSTRIQISIKPAVATSRHR